MAGLHRFGKNGIAVIVVQDEQVVVAGAGGRHKFAGLVGEDLSGGFHDGGIAVMGASAGWVSRGADVWVFRWGSWR